jgi:HAD superfamily phosphoserine phosphatase-like hydrolase
VRRRLEWHRAQGHRIVIVSASLEYYVGPVGDELGVDAVVATRLEVGADGRLTGRYDGRNCRGAQKVARLEQWMEASSGDDQARAGTHAGRAGHATPFLWAYGNSAGDRRLLSAADIGVDVGRLGRLGRLHTFRRLDDVSPTSL